MKQINNGICAAKGFTSSGVHCGIRKNRQKRDLALIYSETPCTAAAVYTQNVVKGAPITVTQENLANGVARAVICNSGNANTCMADGYNKARLMCKLIADELEISENDIIVASTGVIGQPLNMDAIASGIKPLVKALSREGNNDTAEAIMTTDLMQKEFAVETQIGGKTVTIGGIAKGSGMINPNMATMLVFATTDCAISAEMLRKAVKLSADCTFNMISVDGDTSTNDMLSVMANGMAGNAEITTENEDFNTFLELLNTVNTHLSKCIAKDGEGATKLLECKVQNADTYQNARILAKSVISSNLFKAAMFGADANWGRILCALGYSGVQFDPFAVDVGFTSRVGTIDVCVNGGGIDFDEEFAKKVLGEDEIIINVDMKMGNAEASAYGCDLTYDYVKINGDYRT